MPTLASLRIPPPTDGIEFQAIVLDALRQRWRTTEIAIVGRPGQGQNGVDIAGPNDLGLRSGVQCKCVKKLTISMIRDEVCAAEEFSPPLEAYYIATSLPSDATLQKEVRALAEERRLSRQFPVGIVFWDAILGDLAADPDAFRKHHPFVGPASGHTEKTGGFRPLALLDLGYLATDVDVYLDLLLGEAAFLAGEDPHTIARYTIGIESCAVALSEGKDRERLRRLAQELEASSLRMAFGRPAEGETWETVKGLGAKIGAIVSGLQHQLTGRELAVYSVGRGLAKWHSHAPCGDPKEGLSSALVDEIEKFSYVAGLTDVFRTLLLELEAAYRRDESVNTVHIPGRLYHAARTELYAEAVRS